MNYLNKKTFLKSLETYCMFIGYPRSGHSLVGSLLDAHPQIILAHELNALELFKRGFGARQIYIFLMEKFPKNKL